MQTIRFGVVGTGGIAKRFANAAKKAVDVKITAACSRELSRAEDYLHEAGGGQAYSDYSLMLTDPDVDVIYIALPHNFHYETAKEALLAGKGVLCEKCMCVNAAETEELIALAKERNLLLMEAMWVRMLPAYQMAKRWLNDGRIGKLRMIQAFFCFHAPYNPDGRLYNPKLAGGALLDAGVYPIEFALGIAGEAPSIVRSIHTEAATGVDDLDLILLKFPSGATATLGCAVSVKATNDAAICGSDGKIVVRNFVGTRKAELYDNDGNLLDSIEDSEEEGFVHEINHCAQLFRSGAKESPLIPLEDTLTCARIFDEVQKQAKEG
ncbi:MAG: Gfo/Idh/MocA family protein [Oscillospiraceae bacterium]